MSNMTVGLILILLGVVFLLERLNIIGVAYIIRMYWPVILIVTGIVDVVKEKRITYSNGLILIIGLFLQVDKLNIFDIGVWSLFFPVLLIFIGVMEILKGRERE